MGSAAGGGLALAARGGLAVAAGLRGGGFGGRTGGAEGLGQALVWWLDTALLVVRCCLARWPGRLAWAAGLGDPLCNFFG